MNLTLSVITPSYNQGRYIESTIQSVLTQNIPHLEYCIMDGKSTDETLSILKKYEAQCYFQSEKDRGQAHAVNKGIAHTSGQIIGWLNSDDIYYPNALKTVMHFFSTHPHVDVLYGKANHIDIDNQILELYYTEPWNLERLYDVCYLSQPAVFFRRRATEKWGILDESLQYCMDYEYWIRLARGNARFYYLPIILAGSRLHSHTKTHSARIQVHREINHMFKTRLKRVPDRWLLNYAHVITEINYASMPTLKKRRIIAIESFLAALYWNKSIKFAYLRLILKWFISSFQKEKRENVTS